MTARDENVALFSDLHKDLYGCRPGPRQMARFASRSEAEQSAAIDSMAADLGAELDRERAARAAFVAKLADLGLNPEKYLESHWDHWYELCD